MKRSTDRPIRRRRALQILGGGAACLAAGSLTVLTGCSEADSPKWVRFPLEKLPEGARVRVALGEEPVEVLRTADRVIARSLTCTHTGCEVTWIEAADNYLCPCHNARFAANGKVLFGPARFPLATVPARIEGDEVVVGNEPARQSRAGGRRRRPERRAAEESSIG